jgi:hypothetical protein
MMTKIFPTILIVLDVLAALAYLPVGDWRKVVYWLAAAALLIASEHADRICYGMELDPKYCDVIVARWEKLTGRKAELKRN